MKKTAIAIISSIGLLASCGPAEQTLPTSSAVEESSTGISSSSKEASSELKQEWIDALGSSYELAGYDASYYYGKSDYGYGESEFYGDVYGGYWILKANSETYECIRYDVDDVHPELDPENPDAPVTDIDTIIGRFQKNDLITKHNYYFENKMGQVSLGALGLDNQFQEGYFGDSWNWKTSGFANPFGNFKANEFEAKGKNEDGYYVFHYDLPESELEEPLTPLTKIPLGYALGNMAIGTNADQPITSVEFLTDGYSIKKIKFYSTVVKEEETSYSSSYYEYYELYSYDVVALGDDVTIYDGNPVELPSDPDLEKAFDALKASSFRETNIIYTSTNPVDQDSYEYLDYPFWDINAYTVIDKGEESVEVDVYDEFADYGYTSKSNSLLYKVDWDENLATPLAKVGENYYPTAQTFNYVDTGYSYILPSLTLDLGFFEKIGDRTYELDASKIKALYPVSVTSSYLCCYDSFDFEKAVLTLNLDGSIDIDFAISDYYKGEVHFNRVGEVAEPVDLSKFVATTDDLTWGEMLNSSTLSSASAAGLTEDVLDLIPMVGSSYLPSYSEYYGGYLSISYSFSYPGELDPAKLQTLFDGYLAKYTGSWSAPAFDEDLGYYVSNYAEPISIATSDETGNATTKEYSLSVVLAPMASSMGGGSLVIMASLTEAAA